MAILSIQSHVSFGHAGNSSAVFPLQRLGHEVWPVYTVLFSNHTGYGQWRGPVLPADVVSDVVAGIFERCDYTQCAALMTGYLGSPDIAKVVVDTVHTIKKRHPGFIYSCDPVMGDVGRGFYTSRAIQQFFKEHMLSLFDVLLPNQFELEFLTDSKIDTLEQGISQARQLITRKEQIVIVTSLVVEESKVATLLVGAGVQMMMQTPLIDLHQGFAGSGDLFHALFMGNYLKNKSLSHALECAVNTIYDVLLATDAAHGGELQIIANQTYINEPKSAFTVQAL